MEKLKALMQIQANKADLENLTHLIGTVHLDPDELAYEAVNVRIQKKLIFLNIIATR